MVEKYMSLDISLVLLISNLICKQFILFYYVHNA